MNETVIAVDLGGTEIKAALMNRDGRALATRRVATGADRPPAAVIERIAALVAELRKETGDAVLGVGIGSPGGIYPETGIISQNPNFPGWLDVDLCGPLAKIVDLPVAIDNDANLAALGEYVHGTGRGAASMVLLTLGTGIGGGIILDGRIWRGAWGMAGEIGHVIVEPEGHPCGCGSWGCVEQYASGPAMVREARAALAAGQGSVLRELAGGDPLAVTPKMVYEAACAGCETSRAVLHKAARYLGMAMASVLNILNAPLFVIGGGVSAAFDLLYEPLREEVRRRAYRIPGERVRIERALLGNDAGTIGAGMLAFAAAKPPRG
jgi:glucokinase